MAADVHPSDRDVSDLPTHVESYSLFIEIVSVGVFHVANVLVALALGGVEGHWGTAVAFIIVATGLAFYCLMARAKLPMALLLVCGLLALGLHI